MKIALLGYGAMGRLVAAEAQKAGDEMGHVVTTRNSANVDELATQLQGHDVAIDFSVADVVLKHVEACATAQVPLVEGTTGWSDHDEARKLVEEHNSALVYGANFSIGMNVFYRVVQNAAELFASVEQYAPFIEEAHHSRKRDAPSGTALRLRDFMTDRLGKDVPVSATRAGYIPGTHRVGFDSEADQILLTHTARSRQGFASGALWAAKWISGRKGVFEFGEVIQSVVMRR